MKYVLTVTKVEDNPNYDAEKARKAQEDALRGYNYGERYNEQPEYNSRELSVVLTDVEYEAIKREVVTVWK